MAAINILDTATISKIAAGEVVERPLSVVKELVENAIDGGSREIAIQVEDGGHKLIRVSDDGCGMKHEDAELCLRSHTTSKLSRIEDLEGILTLGFRGEALHSIGAVSRIVVTTSDGESEVGRQVKMEGGEVVSSEAAPRVKGTTVEVENIFYNVPARRKFLKSPRSEITVINSLVTNYIIGYPNIGFELTNNGRMVFKVQPGEDHMTRIGYIMGSNISDELAHMTASLKQMGLNAYFSMPDLTFPNRKYQIFFVNGRAVKDRNMTVAVDIAFKGLVPGGRYGLAILFLDLPSSLVDSNVHPTKTEVRFANAHEVHSLIYRTIRGRFIKPDSDEETVRFKLVPQAGPSKRSEPGGAADIQEKKMKSPPVQGEVAFQKPDEPVAAVRAASEYGDPALDSNEPFRDSEGTGDATAKEKPESSPERDQQKISVARFSVLGQFFETFIMVQMDNSPVFVDQHVASERIIYNELKRKTLDKHAQLLLISQPVEVPRDIYEILSENIEKVEKIGLEIEPFGERAFVIRSVVHNAGTFDPAALLLAVAEEIRTATYKAPEDVLLDKLITVASCKMAVKAGQRLTMEEMNLLVEQLLKQEFNRTCPHGRPIFHSISQEMLNSWFKR